MRRVIVIAALSAFLSVPAMADLYGTADVAFASNYSTEKLTVVQSAWGIDVTTPAGLFWLTIDNAVDTGGTNPLTFPNHGVLDDSLGFCIDIFDSTSLVSTKYSVMSLDMAPDFLPTGMGEAKARLVAGLLDAEWSYGYMTSIQAAAVQVAIWEIINETDMTTPLSVSTGDFQVTAGVNAAAVKAAANTMLTNLAGADHDYYIALSHPLPIAEDNKESLQDYVVRIPVPAAVWLGVLGLSAAGLKLRRRSA